GDQGALAQPPAPRGAAPLDECPEDRGVLGVRGARAPPGDRRVQPQPPALAAEHRVDLVDDGLRIAAVSAVETHGARESEACLPGAQRRRADACSLGELADAQLV